MFAPPERQHCGNERARFNVRLLRVPRQNAARVARTECRRFIFIRKTTEKGALLFCQFHARIITGTRAAVLIPAETPAPPQRPAANNIFSRLQNSGTSFKRCLPSSVFRPPQKKSSSALNPVPAFKVRSPSSSPVSSLKLCLPPQNFAPSFKTCLPPQTPPRQSDSACSNKKHLPSLHTSLKINFPVKFCRRQNLMPTEYRSLCQTSRTIVDLLPNPHQIIQKCIFVNLHFAGFFFN